MGQSKPTGGSTMSSGNSHNQDLSHIQELANTLVRHLGVQGARRICMENHWASVLTFIDHQDPH